MTRTAASPRRKTAGSRRSEKTKLIARAPAAGPRAKRRPHQSASTMLEAAGSTVGKVLRGSTDTVKEVGAGLVNTAREVITSTLTARHDAVSVLKAQHREVEELFRKALEARGAQARRELLHEIASALAMHTKIEEDILYPAVRGLGSEEAKLIDEALEEHHVVDLVLAELPRVSPRDDRFDAKMTVLSEIVDHHVKEEERDMFKRAQALGRERLEALGTRLDAAAAWYRGAADRSGSRRP